MILELYSDINKKTPLQKSRIINEESIKNSFFNILNIRDKDILFNYTNNKIPSFIFRNISDENTFSLKNTLTELCDRESRLSVDILDSDIIPDYTNQTYQIYIRFNYKNSNKQETIKFSL